MERIEEIFTMSVWCPNWKNCSARDFDEHRSRFMEGQTNKSRSFYQRCTNSDKKKSFEANLTSTAETTRPKSGQNEARTITRRRRASYKRWQIDVLEEAFEANCYPSTLMKKILAARLNMQNIQVQVWFQNRRARMKKDLPSPYIPSYSASSLQPRVYHSRPSYTRHHPFHLPYTADILNTGRYSCPSFTRYPPVTPMFSSSDLDRVLNSSYPSAHCACSFSSRMTSPLVEKNSTARGPAA